MNSNSLNESKISNFSNHSVLNLSLDSSYSKNSDIESLNSSNFSNNSFRKKINLPIENELFNNLLCEEDEKEIIFSPIINSEIANYFLENNINKKLSKTQNQISINSLKKAPKTKPKISYEYISPLKLNMKTYGNNPFCDKKPNQIISDFQKNILDNKSCNDEEKSDDYYFFDNDETERTTPNLEDLNNLLECRKKMTIFRTSIDEKVSKEYENILNSDLIFFDKEKNFELNNQNKKNNNFWQKHIQKQKKKMSCTMFSSVKLLENFDDNNKVKRAESSCLNNEEYKKDHGLFILGILESAANEKKGRQTINYS